jgi:hypothetical protein
MKGTRYTSRAWLKGLKKTIDATIGNIIFSILFQPIEVLEILAGKTDRLAYSYHLALISEGSLCIIPYGVAIGEDHHSGIDIPIFHYQTIVNDRERAIQRCKRCRQFWISRPAGDAHSLARCGGRSFSLGCWDAGCVCGWVIALHVDLCITAASCSLTRDKQGERQQKSAEKLVI